LLLFILLIVLLDVILDLLPALLLLLIDCLQIFIGPWGRVGLEPNLNLFELRHQFRFWLGQVKLLHDSSSLLILDFFDILLCVGHTSFKFLASCILANLPNQLLAFLLAFDQFGN
jgi:hypothetical protein